MSSTPEIAFRTPARSAHRRAGLAASGWVVLALATAAGCASPPVNYYTLISAPVDSTGRTVPARSSVDFDFALMPVHIPAQDDQTSLVVRKSGEGVVVLENEHWAAPLADEIYSAVSNSLTRQLGASDLGFVSRDSIRRVATITIDVQRFDLTKGTSAGIDAVWSARLTGGPKPVVVSCRLSISRRVAGESYAELVEGQQRVIDAIAEQMAGFLLRWNDQGAVTCPTESRRPTS